MKYPPTVLGRRQLLRSLLVLSAFPACAATSTNREASPEDLRAMIELCDRFLATPESVDPAPIIRFMSDSPEVVVIMGPYLDGLATGDAVPKWASSMLFSGFIAGNVRAQLVAGRKQDDPVAGFRGVLAVYTALQPKGLSMPAVDELAAAEAGGTLEAWVQTRLSAA